VTYRIDPSAKFTTFYAEEIVTNYILSFTQRDQERANSHTHTHTHTQSVCVCVCVYIYIYIYTKRATKK